MHLNRFVTVICLVLSFTGCSSNPPAPVIDRLPSNKPSTPNKPNAISKPNAVSKAPVSRPVYKVGDWRPDTYIVKKGDTLYSIGLEHGYDYKEIAQANNISAPYNIKVGQPLKFSALKDKPVPAENKPVQTSNDDVVITPINNDSNATSTVATSSAPTTAVVVAITEPKAIREPYSEEAYKKPLPVAKPVIEKPAAVATAAKPVTAIENTNKPSNTVKPENKPEPKADSKAEEKAGTGSPEDIDWAWPTKGKVVTGFNETSNKGVDIAGTAGQAVNAAAAGKIIYSGSDLRGYGKLVIIKHNSTYLSVYAHNSQIVIKEGQQVSRGQKIAEMGNTDSNSVNLHFEIRRQGKSVDPSKYLTAD
jgi:lipoprotein NlpD